MNKTKRAALLVAVVGMAALASPAQSTNPPPSGGLLANLNGVLGLYNENLDAFTNRTAFELQTGLNFKSDVGGIQQDITAGVFHEFKPALRLGLQAGVDTLGEEGNNVDAFHVNVAYRYTKHNLGVDFKVGYYHDIDIKKHAVEGGIGLTAYVTKNVGVFASYQIGKYIESAGKGESIYGRLVAGATVQF